MKKSATFGSVHQPLGSEELNPEHWMFLRSGFNYDRDLASDESGLKCEDKSLARQSELEDSDINVIVKRFGLTGQLPSNVRVPSYGDFTSPLDFHQAMNLVSQANEAFLLMPAAVRSRFENDPGKFMDFVHDDANREEAEKLGLVVPKVPEEPVGPVEVVVVASPVAPPAGKA